MCYKLGSILFFIYLCNAANGASILALFSSLSFTDHLIFRGYVSLLAQKGHSLVVMTPYPGQFQYPDVERIVELDVGAESAKFWDEFKYLTTTTDDYFPRQRAMNELSLKIAIAQLRSKQMTALLINPNIKFDLVIAEADVPLLYAAAEKYKAPLIAITTSSGTITQHESKGNPVHPPLYLNPNTLSLDQNMTGWQKIVEVYRYYQTNNEYYNNYLPLSEIAAKKILGLKRGLLEVEHDIDMLFIASNKVLMGNRPTVPAVVYVDRLNVKPGLHLPQNLQAQLDAAPKGVIYFSIGAVLEAESLAPSILQTMADAFRELPYTVLWKIGNTTMINKPDNVIAQSWFPQQEILAHPNVKAFITSGGTRSLEEAVYYNVPVIGFPILKPRKNYIKQIMKFGAGEILDPYNLNKDAIISTIQMVANDGKYKQSITQLKDMVFDPVLPGPESAVWWTEYVLRHHGAKHLRAPAVNVGLFKYYMLDYVFTLFFGSLIVLIFSFIVLSFIMRKVRSKYYGVVDMGGKFKAL